MKHIPLVTIIIPCYNQEKYLNETYESLNDMSYKNWECIIIDDGSTDNSLEVIKSISTLDKRVKYISKENGGTASARNKGISEASGEYIQFLDADDYLDPEKIEKQLSFMVNSNLDVSYTNSANFYFNAEGEKVIEYASRESCEYSSSLRKALITRWGIDFSIPMHSWLFLTSFIRNNKIMFDEKFRVREDWNFHLLVSLYKPAIGHMLNFVGSYYRMNPEGKTSSFMKISSGNYKFIYKRSLETKFYDSCLFCYRLSCELWQTLLRAIKHKNLRILLHPCEYITNLLNALLLISSVVSMPLSFFRIFRRFFKQYLR